MDLDGAREPPCEVGEDDVLELPVSRPARQAGRDEQSLPLERNADPLELGDRRRQRDLPRVASRARDRERRWLDDDRYAAPSRDEVLDARARERKTQGLVDRRAHVGERLSRRGRTKDHGVVGDRNDLKSRAGE